MQIPSRPLAGLAWVLAVCVSGACDGATPPPTTAAELVTTLQVEDASGQPRADFARGEPMQFQLSVSNRSAVAATVPMALCGEQDNYVVLQSPGATPVWNAAATEAHCNVLPVTPLVLQPGQTVQFSILWNQTDSTGNPLPAGSYEVMAGILCAPAAAVEGAGCMAGRNLGPDALRPSRYRSAMVQFSIH
jgi:hypothetical protein